MKVIWWNFNAAEAGNLNETSRYQAQKHTKMVFFFSVSSCYVSAWFVLMYWTAKHAKIPEPTFYENIEQSNHCHTTSAPTSVMLDGFGALWSELALAP